MDEAIGSRGKELAEEEHLHEKMQDFR